MKFGTLFILYKNHVFSAQPGKRDRDNYRQFTTLFLNFELILFWTRYIKMIWEDTLDDQFNGTQPKTGRSLGSLEGAAKKAKPRERPTVSNAASQNDSMRG